jgi:formylglycine-generating enzyme required for sulfatase activity
MTPEQVRGLFPEWKFVRIQPGSYIRGDDQGASRERPAHRVEISRAFLLQVGEVTQDQWLAVMHRNPSRHLWCGPTCPVERVAWEDVEVFIRRLNVIDPGKNYRLPTEAEWEYAARAGDSVLVEDSLLGTRAWYAANADRRTHPTMGKQPNAWGLYDLQGNVAEWVANRYTPFSGDTSREKATRGLADSMSRGRSRELNALADSSRVARGGSWASAPRGLRPSAREFPGAAFALFGLVGFRLARDQ